MSLGLGGLIGMGNYCHMCASHYCMHTSMGMAAQQQMGMQQYNDLLRYAQNAGCVSSSGTVTVTDSSATIAAGVPTEPTRVFDKKLLLLRR